MNEQLAEGQSLLHKIDPRVKILVATAYVAVVAISNSFVVAAMGLVCSLILILFTKIPVGILFKRLLGANIFTLFLWITLPLTYKGTTWQEFLFFTISTEGVHLAALITLKTNGVILAFISLLGTSRVVNLGHALDSLHIPTKLCFLILFSYRYIFVIYEEYQKLKRAASLRCFSPGTNLHTYQTYGYLFGMTLIQSHNRARRVHNAMLLRGFSGQLRPLHEQILTKKDVIFFLVSIAIICFLPVLQLL